MLPHTDQPEDRAQVLKLRLANFRKNRETCPELQRLAYDTLIRQTEEELANLDGSTGSNNGEASGDT
jgi:hypothetical protein